MVPKSGKVFTGGSNKDDLMFGHWEKHKYDGGKVNDHIFTWYGKDTLLGGDGNDHLYADRDDYTMVGYKGNDFFYLDGDSTTLIKDYRKQGKEIISVDGYNKGDIKISTKSGNSLVMQANIHLLKSSESRISARMSCNIQAETIAVPWMSMTTIQAMTITGMLTTAHSKRTK